MRIKTTRKDMADTPLVRSVKDLQMVEMVLIRVKERLAGQHDAALVYVESARRSVVSAKERLRN